MNKSIIFAAMLLAASPAWAQPPQTADDCIMRYGHWDEGMCWFRAVGGSFKLSGDDLPLHMSVKLSVDTPNWHLLTISHGGTVSLIKGLTEAECTFAKHRALGEPATYAERDEAARRKLALDAVTDEVTARWEAWKREHACKSRPDNMISDPSTSEKSFKSDSGICVRGSDFFYPGEGWRHLESLESWQAPSGIKSAECFQ